MECTDRRWCFGLMNNPVNITWQTASEVGKLSSQLEAGMESVF